MPEFVSKLKTEARWCKPGHPSRKVAAESSSRGRGGGSPRPARRGDPLGALCPPPWLPEYVQATHSIADAGWLTGTIRAPAAASARQALSRGLALQQFPGGSPVVTEGHPPRPGDRRAAALPGSAYGRAISAGPRPTTCAVPLAAHCCGNSSPPAPHALPRCTGDIRTPGELRRAGQSIRTGASTPLRIRFHSPGHHFSSPSRQRG
jgi:hypothetical protein